MALRKLIKEVFFGGSQKKISENEFVSFVGDQFRQLTKKNLGVPVKFYHL